MHLQFVEVLQQLILTITKREFCSSKTTLRNFLQAAFDLKKLGKDQKMASLPVKTQKKIKKLKSKTLESRCNKRLKAIRMLLKMLFIHGFFKPTFAFRATKIKALRPLSLTQNSNPMIPPLLPV